MSSLFTLLTLNMQCSLNGTRHEQLLQLVDIIKSNKIICVCLQDLNLTSLSILKSKLHKYSLIEALTNGTPQVIIYSNECKMEEEFCYDLPSEENREVIGCKLVFKEKEYEILNVWLEKEQSKFREKQVEVLLEVASPKTIIVGDFNIFQPNEASNSLLLQSKLCDAWITSGCNPLLRNTTFYEGEWYRTVRLLYLKNSYSITCNGLFNNDCDNSMVSYDVVTALQ